VRGDYRCAALPDPQLATSHALRIILQRPTILTRCPRPWKPCLHARPKDNSHAAAVVRAVTGPTAGQAALCNPSLIGTHRDIKAWLPKLDHTTIPPLPSCVPASARDRIPDECAHLKSSLPQQLSVSVIAYHRRPSLACHLQYYSTIYCQSTAPILVLNLTLQTPTGLHSWTKLRFALSIYPNSNHVTIF
jgi:hypothetical protein